MVVDGWLQRLLVAVGGEMGYSIRLIGVPEIVDESNEPRPVRGYQSWALLARMLLADRPLTRRELSGDLFPDTVDPMGSLRWCLAGLRRAVGSSEAFAGDPVQLGLPKDTAVDVWAFGDQTPLDVANIGELLEGVSPKCGPEFETWLMIERERVAALVNERVRREVITALSARDCDRAVELAELGARRALFDEGAQVLLVKSLSEAGLHDAASAHVEETEARFRDELGAAPSPALRSASRRHVADPPQGVSGRSVAASLLESGLAAIAAGAIDAGVDCLRRACRSAETCRDDQLHAQCLLELGSGLVHSMRSHDDEGAVLLQQCADLSTSIGDSQLAVSALREMAYVDALAGRRPSAASHLDRALGAAGDDDDLLAGVRSVVAFNLTDWGRHDEAVEEFNSALELARSARNQRRETWTLGLGGWAHLAAGDSATARNWLIEALNLVTELRWVAFGPWPRALLAEIDNDAGADPARIRSQLDETFSLSCQLGDPCWEGATARVIAQTCARVGQHDQALDWITQARHRCLRETDTYVAMHAAILATDAELSLAAGERDRADTTTRALIALAARTHMDAHLAHGLELLNTGPV